MNTIELIAKLKNVFCIYINGHSIDDPFYKDYKCAYKVTLAEQIDRQNYSNYWHIRVFHDYQSFENHFDNQEQRDAHDDDYWESMKNSSLDFSLQRCIEEITKLIKQKAEIFTKKQEKEMKKHLKAQALLLELDD